LTSYFIKFLITGNFIHVLNLTHHFTNRCISYGLISWPASFHNHINNLDYRWWGSHSFLVLSNMTDTTISRGVWGCLWIASSLLKLLKLWFWNSLKNEWLFEIAHKIQMIISNAMRKNQFNLNERFTLQLNVTINYQYPK